MQKSLLKNSGNKKDMKRKVILDAAAKVFSKKGYNDTSIKDITDEAGVAVGSFYSFFQNKEDILGQIFDELLDISLKIASNIQVDESDHVIKKFTFAMTGAIWTFVKNKELSKILLVKSMGINENFEKKRWEILEKTNVLLRGVLEHLNDVHSVRLNDIDITSVLLTQSIFGVISYWLDERLTSDIKEMIFTVCTYHAKALSLIFSDDEIRQYIDDALSSDY